MRLRGKVDLNQREIVEALRKAGAKVAITSNLGNGYGDLVVGFRGTMMWMECKSKGGRLTQDEKEFYSEWLPYMVVVYSVEDALKAIGAM
jgi:Holliday junction resolvase